MYKHSLFILFVILSHCEVFSQTSATDSLERCISKNIQKDTVWINSLIELEELYYRTNPEKMGKYVETILEESKKQHHTTGLLNGYTCAIHQNIWKGAFENAAKQSLLKLKIAEQSNDWFHQADTYSLLGNIYALSGSDKKKPLKYYLEAHKVINLSGKSHPKYFSMLVSVNNNIGLAYDELKQPIMAGKY